MKKFMARMFYRLMSLIGTNNAKKLLWNGLRLTVSETYQPGGEGEEVVLGLLSKKCDFQCAIDVGANVGKWSEILLSVSPECNIYAVEPVPEFFNKIDAKEQIIKFNLALSSKHQTLRIYQSGGGAKPFEKNTKGKSSVMHEIKAVTGDVFISENKIDKVDIIKIDTDGFDFEVLSGFYNTIKNHQPIIQFELSHWWLRMGYTLELARSFLSELGYSLFLMTEDGLTEIRFELPEVLFVTANIMALPQQTSFEKLYQDEIIK